MQSSKSKISNIICKILVCIFAIMILSLITIFFSNTESTAEDSPDVPVTDTLLFPITNADSNTNIENAQYIDLNQVTNELLIESGGIYLLEGSLNNKVIVDAEEQIVHLILNGVSISSKSGSAITVRSAGKVILTLPEGTQSSLRDTSDYENSSEENSCIYSECDLTINGFGTMNVHGYFKDAIHSKDTLKILNSQLVIQAKREAIRGNDGILLKNTSIQIECEKTGLYSKNIGRNYRGTIQISESNLSVIAGEYAISSAGDLYIDTSNAYLKGIISDFNVSGNSYIQEGCLQNE